MPYVGPEQEVPTWNSATSPRTLSVTVGAGETLAVLCGAADEPETFLVTGGGLTWDEVEELSPGSHGTVGISVATSPTAQTFTLSVASSQGNNFGFILLRFPAMTAGDAVSNITTEPAVATVVTTRPNSAIACILIDWDAGNPSGGYAWNVTAGAVIELAAVFVSGSYTIYAAVYPDVGAQGSKTVGLQSLPGTAAAMVIAAVELQAVPSMPAQPMVAGRRATNF